MPNTYASQFLWPRRKSLTVHDCALEIFGTRKEDRLAGFKSFAPCSPSNLKISNMSNTEQCQRKLVGALFLMAFFMGCYIT